jgi:hypothetical protein
VLAANGQVTVELVAQSTHNGIAAGDTLTFQSSCGDVSASTDDSGTATTTLHCTLAAFPLTVTVTDGAGVALTVHVPEP